MNLLAWEHWLRGQRGNGRRGCAGSSRQVLSRKLVPCLAEGSGGVSEMSALPVDPKESAGPAGSTWPAEVIPLGPGESAREVVCKKIQELSGSVWSGGKGRGVEGQGGEGVEQQCREERVSLGRNFCEHKIRPSVSGFISQLARSYSKAPFSGNRGAALCPVLAPSRHLGFHPGPGCLADSWERPGPHFCPQRLLSAGLPVVRRSGLTSHLCHVLEEMNPILEPWFPFFYTGNNSGAYRTGTL